MHQIGADLACAGSEVARAEGVDRVRSIGITGTGVHAEPRAVDDQVRSLPFAGSFDGSAIGDVERAAPRAAT